MIQIIPRRVPAGLAALVEQLKGLGAEMRGELR